MAGVSTAELREEGTEAFFMQPTNGTRGGIEAGSMQLTKVKVYKGGKKKFQSVALAATRYPTLVAFDSGGVRGAQPLALSLLQYTLLCAFC